MAVGLGRGVVQNRDYPATASNFEAASIAGSLCVFSILTRFPHILNAAVIIQKRISASYI